MSYRQPQIIQDKSGMIIPQALAQASGALAKGIQTFGVEERKREAKAEAKRLKDNKQLIDISNAHAKNSAVFNAGLTEMSESMRGTLISRNERLLDEIDSIKRAQIIDGNTSPDLSKRLGELQQGLLEGNGLSKKIIATSGILTELLENEEKLNTNLFYKEDKSGSDEQSKTIVMAFGGVEGYKGSMLEEEGKLHAVATNPDGQTFKIPASEFDSIADDLILEKKVNAATEQINFTKKALFDGNELREEMIDSRENFLEFESGSRITGSRSILNTDMVNSVRQNSVNETQSLIQSAAGNSQLQDKYLEDLGLDPKVFRKADNLQKIGMVAQRSASLFDDANRIYQDNSGNYYFDDVQTRRAIPATEREAAVLYNRYSNDLNKAMEEGKDKETALADVFNIGGNKRIRIGGGYYTPKNISIEGDIVTVTKTGKPKQETEGGEDLDIVTFDLSDPKVLYNFLQSTTALKDAQINKIRKQILSYK
jgi:hypothetical protein